METETRYPIYGETGKIREWLAAGGVNVWRNVDLGHWQVGSLTFTPNTGVERQVGPHWRYGAAPIEVVRDESRFRFFDAMSVMAVFSISTRGYRAARKQAASILRIEGPYPRETPTGTLTVELTIESLTYESTMRRDDRPLDTEYRYGIVRWVSFEPAAEAAPDEGAA